MIVPAWHDGLDEVEKIGWPWHGRLEDIGGGASRLTTDAGVVVDFPAGDLSHPISGAVAAGGWRAGWCQRYKIPGLPIPVTTPGEQSLGMTWLNYFIHSGIANPGGYQAYDGVYIDSDAVPWRIAFAQPQGAKVPTGIQFLDAAGQEVLLVSIAGQAFSADLPPSIYIGATQSEDGAVHVRNVFGSALQRPVISYRIDIAGSVAGGSVTATMSKLIDNSFGLTTVNSPPFEWSATWQRHHVHQLYQYGDSWGYVPGFDTPGTDTGGSVSGVGAPSFSGHPFQGVFYYTHLNPPPPLPLPGPNYAWDAGPLGSNTFAGGGYIGYSEHREDIYEFSECLGFFVGIDGSVVDAWAHSRRVIESDTVQSFDPGMSRQTVERHLWDDWIAVGGIESPKIQTLTETHTVVDNLASVEYGPERPRFVNGIRYNRNFIVQCSPSSPGIQLASIAIGQFQLASLYPATIDSSIVWPPLPNLSVHPVSGAIATRSDGLPISWV